MANNTILTHEKRSQFLALLAEYGNVTRAAEESGLGRVYLYQARKHDPDFAAEWDDASKVGAARLEDEARKRAAEGWDEPVWYQGVQCGTVRKYSDTLLICLLKAHHPDKYADRQKTDATISADVSVSHTISPETAAAVSWLFDPEPSE